MNEKELKRLITAGETETLEFKENFDRETMETAGAFANTKGGIILIGISNTAGVFYDIGLIEQWGSGIDKMRKACIEAGLPEPQFEEHQGFRVIFRKDIYTEEYLRELGLNERQMKAVMYVKEKGKIANKEYQRIASVKERLATIELNDLVSKNILQKFGTTGRGTYYAAIKAQKPHERRNKGAKRNKKSRI